MQTIIFSKNRAAQLDLLLRSIAERAPDLFDEIHVLYKATDNFYLTAYSDCMLENPSVNFWNELSFQEDLKAILSRSESELVTFLCDDDLVVRQFMDTDPLSVLELFPQTICLSLRLGMNTVTCYPLRRSQVNPKMAAAIRDFRLFEWKTGDGDWGYPGSLDGHIFRRHQLDGLIRHMSYDSPNRLEEKLVAGCKDIGAEYDLMGCYESSLITGVPINRVQETHPNRAGELYPNDPGSMNHQFLDGYRLQLDPIGRKEIKAAHTELQLVFA